jgi:FMNH2-dependent dimethyl sulfone monooxygenase
MRLGLWTPLPHVIRPEAAIVAALEDLATPGQGAAVDRSFSFALEAVRQAEALGFDITLVAERFVARDLEAWVVASALAALTSRITIMTAAHPGIVPPQVVAKMGASLDRLSGGRFALNVVPGNRPEEFACFGNGAWLDDTGARYQRMDEYIDMIAALWSGAPVSRDGAFYQLDEGRLATRPLQVPMPPIYAASSAEAGKEIIARRCQCWFVSHPPGLENYEANAQKVARDIADMRTRAAAHGRSLGYGLSTLVLCAPSDEAAEAQAAALDTSAGGNVAARALGAGLVGSPRRIRDRLRRYEDAGIDLVMLQFHPMGEGLQRFAEEVMPLLA